MVGSARSTFGANLAFLEKHSTKQLANPKHHLAHSAPFKSGLKLHAFRLTKTERRRQLCMSRAFGSTKTEAPENDAFRSTKTEGCKRPRRTPANVTFQNRPELIQYNKHDLYTS